jgi:hypothetical protein
MFARFLNLDHPDKRLILAESGGPLYKIDPRFPGVLYYAPSKQQSREHVPARCYTSILHKTPLLRRHHPKVIHSHW